MKTTMNRAVALGACALACVATTDAALAAQRTFVSVSGNDANPCSVAAPCRSFPFAIAAADPGGEVVVLDSGGYGAFSIGKSVSITVPAGVYAGISVFSGDGVAVNGAGIKVALRGLTINGQGGIRGIVVTDAAAVSVDDCTIAGLGLQGLVVDANASVAVSRTQIRSTGDAGAWIKNGQVTLNGVAVRGTGGAGVSVANGYAEVRDSVIARTGAQGIIVNPSTGNTARVTIERTMVSFTHFEGIYATSYYGGTASVVATDNVVADNDGYGGIVAESPATTMRVSGNKVVRAATYGFLNSSSAAFESHGDNVVQGSGSGTTFGSLAAPSKY